MISRRTIISLLLALLILLVLRASLIGRWDPCGGIIPSTHRPPASVNVDEGTRTVEVSCDSWLLRQPAWVQLTLIVDGAVLVVFLLSAWSDWRRLRTEPGR